HPGAAARQLRGVVVVIVEDGVLAGAPAGTAQLAMAGAGHAPDAIQQDGQDHQDAQYDQNFPCAKIHEFLCLCVRLAWCPASATVGSRCRRPGLSATQPALSVNHFPSPTKRLLTHRKDLNQACSPQASASPAAFSTSSATSRDTPGSCIVTPTRWWAISMA